jgi:TATA-binding protein-associated factor Taf7
MKIPGKPIRALGSTSALNTPSRSHPKQRDCDGHQDPGAEVSGPSVSNDEQHCDSDTEAAVDRTDLIARLGRIRSHPKRRPDEGRLQQCGETHAGEEDRDDGDTKIHARLRDLT